MAGAAAVIPGLNSCRASAMNGAFQKPLVVVTVGGDHHPFDRLMRWVEDWLADEGEQVRCLVQHGTARPPEGAEACAYIDHDDLLRAMANARAVVSSGGPTTLSEARLLGHRPIAVPRQSRLGEHVDDHQLIFTSRLHALGLVARVESEADFRTELTAALEAPRIVVPVNGALQDSAVWKVGELIDSVARRPRARGTRLPGQVGRERSSVTANTPYPRDPTAGS